MKTDSLIFTFPHVIIPGPVTTKSPILLSCSIIDPVLIKQLAPILVLGFTIEPGPKKVPLPTYEFLEIIAVSETILNHLKFL